MVDVWILGAAGRVGGAVASDLAAAGASVVLVGRNGASLKALADRIGGRSRIVTSTSFEGLEAELANAGPIVVANLIGPFSETAIPTAMATAPGSSYLDLSNELPAMTGILKLDQIAVATNRCFVSGAGWGVLAAEAAVLKLCKDRPPAIRVRIDVAPFIDAPGLLGLTVAATVVDAIPVGTTIYDSGMLVRTGIGSHREILTAPDGSKIGTGAVATGDLEAARRASGAPFAIAASTMAPSAPMVRAMMPLVTALFGFKGVREFVKKRVANINVPPAKGPPKPSWAHARVEWDDGTVAEVWLKAGEGMAFTAKIAAEVALRLSRNEGRPGAFTPGALFGAELAETAGAEFFIQ
jgi:short subunit dehydrogenase-like uncharacterized protein